ncbi:MAG: c-type cytochrome [Rhodospirillaceae bacterium]|jgi:DMSO reductase family type II enzyme heme b subunit|nr:c-type cytochrome [Rhodospirillaceae bacterium]MBT3885419.1 c-type cytochrome [Rhodospirillaceae bacterium]MBT4117529.1 c-type cytochrome [Rhodospirillaceae bacterium]MBT4670640.1 c-type cytochrome [Rhodospirillaceae bacterium]MBT4721107.1 c-type cytochrome [Rhodospirillaceae bacterium]
MMKAAIILIVAGTLALAASNVLAADIASKPMPEATEAFTEQGHQIYIQRCSFCHGLLGDGNGPAAKYMDPRPRDFTLGTFKFRTTQSGELPTDTDLFRTVSRGLKGTGMQAFDNQIIKNGLSEEQRWQVISYIKTFAPEFDDDELDPVKTGKVVELPASTAPYNAETVAKGKAVFERAKCWECHGRSGRGDGQKSFDRKDDWGFPIRIRNLTHPWKIKAGDRVEDIFMRFSTGISGTPMPSFVKALNDEDRWALANFIKSLQHKLTNHQVLKALRVEGDVPLDPKAAEWATAEAMDVRLAGQVVAAPRWQNPSIELVTMRAAFNDKEIAFLMEWDDPFKDTTHKEGQVFNAKEISKVGAFNSYIEGNGMIPRKLETFRDSIALQFPSKETSGTKKPHFYRGGSSIPVNLWIWKADADAAGKRAVDDAGARGWKQPVRAQGEKQQQVTSKAEWAAGRWRVVMKRPLTTPDRGDVQFSPGRFIPMSVNAWDGSNGEHGLIMSLSTWHYVFLEAPTPAKIYIYALLAVLITGGLGFWFRRIVRNAPADA